jgi:hypothetical protein
VNTSIVSAIEKLLLIADHHDDAQQLSIDVQQISEQIQTILVMVNSALRNVGHEPMRDDLEEIRLAAVRAVRNVRVFKAANDSNGDGDHVQL